MDGYEGKNGAAFIGHLLHAGAEPAEQPVGILVITMRKRDCRHRTAGKTVLTPEGLHPHLHQACIISAHCVPSLGLALWGKQVMRKGING